MSNALPPVVLHTSWSGLSGAAITPVALAVIGGWSIAAGGASAVPVAVVVVGAVLGAVVLFDYPYAARIGADGVTRRCLARSHHLAWDRIVALERTRPSTMTVVRNLSGRDEAQVSGGLVARGAGKRRWLLVDRAESRMEYDALQELLATADVPVVLRAPRPHATAPPTYLYRRRRRDRDSAA